MRERREVAAGAERTVFTHDGREAVAEQRQLEIDDLRVARPERAIDRLRARSSSIARTTSRSTGSPMPAACERISASCISAVRSGGMTVLASDPKPVVTP